MKLDFDRAFLIHNAVAFTLNFFPSAKFLGIEGFQRPKEAERMEDRLAKTDYRHGGFELASAQDIKLSIFALEQFSRFVSGDYSPNAINIINSALDYTDVSEESIANLTDELNRHLKTLPMPVGTRIKRLLTGQTNAQRSTQACN